MKVKTTRYDVITFTDGKTSTGTFYGFTTAKECREYIMEKTGCSRKDVLRIDRSIVTATVSDFDVINAIMGLIPDSLIEVQDKKDRNCDT